MWLSTPSADSLTRPRIAVALFSAVAAASIGYYAYQTQSDPASTLSGPGLHRSNAIRRGHRRSRQPSLASDTSPTDENADAEAGPHPLQDDETVVEEWWNDPNALTTPARAGHNIVSLLFRVSEDNARRNACVHRGCACNACGMVPIRGVRYRCANCADFDLCETCEAQGMHIKTHIFYKIKIPAPPFGPRQMQPVWYAGDPDTCIRNLPRSLMQRLSKDTGFERPEIEAFWEQFTFMANTEWRSDPDGLHLAMDRKTFERCLVPSGGSRHATPNLIHDRMLAFYDTNHDGLIGFAEFLHGLAYRKRKDKLRRIFEGYDIDGDGLVNRRDFLRMFRAYYVLYKQMHRDILDGLDDQLLGSTEAQQLITSRQPLSSLFGREGRIPRAEGGHRSEGKIFHPNGDVELENGKTVIVSEERGDTSTRGDILTRLFAPSVNSHSFDSGSWAGPLRSPGSEPDAAYWDALLDPPSGLEELPGLLTGRRGVADDLDLDLDVEMTSPEDEVEPGHYSDDEAGSQAGDESPRLNGDSAQTVNPEEFSNAMPTESQLRAQVMAQRRQHAPEIDKKRRRAARQRLHDRWKRRQFYLDEEEGATEPDGWEDDEDVLINLNGVAGSSKAPQTLSPRSRSSSKVRFAEDMDDLDVRSNPSTSSRSVPERWGGFDIPDEERDAGKEILYQVTQQAFNELLDSIFKDAEDLALDAAETKTQRDKHRALFENVSFEEDAEAEGAAQAVPSPPPVSESKPIAERSLEELLQTSGYTVDPELASPAAAGSKEQEQELDHDHEQDQADAAEDFHDETPLESVETQEQEHRDPTMPQFRPSQASYFDVPTESPITPAPRKVPRKSALKKRKKALPEDDVTDISLSTLRRWKRLDLAEKTADERGGWGKLSFEEFEDIYKSHENAGNRLDYLGSWVDFCIP